MKRAAFVGLALLLAVGFGMAVSSASRSGEAAEPCQGEACQAAPKLRHVVLFKFKDDSTPEQVRTVEDAFRALPEKIDAIIEFEWGTNNSPEGLAQGFTHCFLVTFKDEKGRDIYLPHPAHKEFVEVLKPHLDKVLVVDYFAKD